MRERIAARPDAFYGFWLGQSYREPPPGARLAELGDPPDLYRYGPLRGEQALLDAIVAKLAAKNGVRVTAKNLVVTAGGAHAASVAMQAVLAPGDEVLMLSPHWPYNRGHVLATGARHVEVPFSSRELDDGAPAAARIEPYITPRTAAILYASPNNPDGHVMSDRDLEDLAELARRHDLWVIADEVYEDFVYDGRHRSIATLPGMAERTLTTYSLSKSYSLAGARVGYVVAPEAVATRVLGAACHSVFHPTIIAQRIAVRAIATGDDYLADCREDFRGARDLAVERLAPFGVRAPAGGLYVFLDLAPLARGGRTVADVLDRLCDDGLPLCPGDVFGTAYGQRARLCFGAMPRARLAEGLDKLVDALERLRRDAG